MDTEQFDALTARISPHLTRRRSLGLLGSFGALALSAETMFAGKGKKKKKKKKGKKQRCPSGDYVCPQGSKLACCPNGSECCPTAYEKPGACCSEGCCQTANDCEGTLSCLNGCCYSY